MIYGTATPRAVLHQEIEDKNIDTMEKVFAHAVQKHGDRNCLGTREVISEEEMLDHNTGKVMKKYELGDYNWKSFNETSTLVNNLSAGFASLGIEPQGKIAVLAETRQEWFLTAMAAFKRNLKSKSYN